MNDLPGFTSPLDNRPFHRYRDFAFPIRLNVLVLFVAVVSVNVLTGFAHVTLRLSPTRMGINLPSPAAGWLFDEHFFTNQALSEFSVGLRRSLRRKINHFGVLLPTLRAIRFFIALTIEVFATLGNALS